jgi:hypothetical protein
VTSTLDDESDEAHLKLFEFVRRLHELDDDEVLSLSEEREGQIEYAPQSNGNHNYGNQD